MYEEGWQSWSPAGVQLCDGPVAAAGERRPPDDGLAPGRALPEDGFQAEGVLAVAPPGGHVRVW